MNLDTNNMEAIVAMLMKELKKVEKGNIETQLLYYSVFVPNFLRRCLGKEISNVQKIPKF